MTDDVAVNPAAEEDVVVTPPGGEDTQDASIQAQEADGEEDTQEETTPELIDVEYDGKVHKVPPELRDALLRQADYTRKTQDVADQRRAVEAEREALNRERAEAAQLQEDIGQAAYLGKLIGEYEKVDWQALQQANPEQAQAQWMLFQQLERQRNQAQTRINETKQKQALEQQQMSAKQFEEGQRVLQRDIKGWGADLAGKLVDFAASQGIPRQMIDVLGQSPDAVKLLHRAWLAEQTLKKAATAAENAAKPASQVTAAPLKQVSKARSGPAPAAGPSDSDDIEDWVRKRNAQIRKRNT